MVHQTYSPGDFGPLSPGGSGVCVLTKTGHKARVHTNDHFLTDTTKDEKWLVLVGQPSLAAISVGGRGRPLHCTEARPTGLFSYKLAVKKISMSF